MVLYLCCNISQIIKTSRNLPIKKLDYRNSNLKPH
nr:MAG TPA: hypothetical protein [Caudoviricetes sp.]